VGENLLASLYAVFETTAFRTLPWNACGMPVSFRREDRAAAASRSLLVSCMSEEGGRFKGEDINWLL